MQERTKFNAAAVRENNVKNRADRRDDDGPAHSRTRLTDSICLLGRRAAAMEDRIAITNRALSPVARDDGVVRCARGELAW